ncbi:MAG TPA: PhzF family phenazine biosynthesis isomerase [Jiangellales bacterium]|nr:PhzF family phenazine biosynthesis isomerase [Jiangellales bacterium]
MPGPEVLRYAAFTTDPSGGNPAGVVLEAGRIDDAEMLAVATDVGYSETAFLTRGPDHRSYAVRYFSPRVEVPFCGHATVATGVALAERQGPGRFLLETPVGPVTVDTHETGEAGDGFMATLESVPARSRPATEAEVTALLDALRWQPADLDPAWPPHLAFAGAEHPVLVTGSRERLATLDYDFTALQVLMDREGWTTVQLAHADPGVAGAWHVRDPFPVGGVVEDPATGAAAAAFGAYLRELGRARPGDRLVLLQGEDMGRPSRLDVEVGAERVRVGGRAVTIP